MVCVDVHVQNLLPHVKEAKVLKVNKLLLPNKHQLQTLYLVQVHV